ncbi:hypothetical protein TIFTF001_004318 [Ficus carica]|uniref:Uncharacterized protein n=1 Tax=Ficus carica TaxID=3494 RepID=A0AA88CXL0_FICCA|nr:hypothetical protein TIFTF001_004318 [Ficus carica]
MQFSGKIIRQHELVVGNDAIKVAPVGLEAPILRATHIPSSRCYNGVAGLPLVALFTLQPAQRSIVAELANPCKEAHRSACELVSKALAIAFIMTLHPYRR